MTHTQTQGADGADDAGTEWFWRIVDANGLGNVPSDETEALRLLCTKAAWYDEGQSASTIPPDVRSLLRTARSGLATYGAGAFEGTIVQIDAILANDPILPAPAATPGVPDSLRALSEAATLGEWSTESEKCDGSYGSGEDCGEGYFAYSILTDAEPRYGNPGVIADTINSTLGVIHEESHEDGFTAWDETARANTAFIVAAVNFVRFLLASHPAGQSEDDADRCIACNKLLKAGERVLPDAEGGTIHAACCGPERESYTGADSEPLGPNDPIPQGYVYQTAGQSAGSGAEKASESLRPDWHRAMFPDETAPDSTRTGQGEADISAAVEAAWRVFYASCGGSPFLPETHGRWEKAIRAALAARPAAPEVAGVPMIVKSADGWHVLGEDGQRFDLVPASCQPPASSGQGGR